MVSIIRLKDSVRKIVGAAAATFHNQQDVLVKDPRCQKRPEGGYGAGETTH